MCPIFVGLLNNILLESLLFIFFYYSDFLKYLLYFVKMCPIFVGSINIKSRVWSFTKSQLISKYFIGILHSPKETTNKFDLTTGIP